jgi:hypothetical protein
MYFEKVKTSYNYNLEWKEYFIPPKDSLYSNQFYIVKCWSYLLYVLCQYCLFAYSSWNLELSGIRDWSYIVLCYIEFPYI